LGLGKGLVLIALLLAGPVTAHALASAAYCVGIAQSQAFCDDLVQVVEQSQPTFERNVG